VTGPTVRRSHLGAAQRPAVPSRWRTKTACVASFADGKIEAYVGPPELGGADDLERVIVDFIAGAKSTLDIAVQEIDSRAIAQAILDARWRGVRIMIFLEQDYIRRPERHPGDGGWRQRTRLDVRGDRPAGLGWYCRWHEWPRIAC